MILGGLTGSRCFFSKKAQAAAAAAVLVAIIGAVLVSYVILVSPDERAAILDGEINSDSDDSPSSGDLLLEEFPGRIEYLSVEEVEHSLASVHVYTQKEVQTIAERQTLLAKRTVFSDKSAEATFSLEDLSLVSNTQISFRVEESSGVLSVQFNGQLLLEREFSTTESVTLDLPDDALQNVNTLTFSVSSPGAAFWQSNSVQISSLIVVADVTDESHQEATGVFSISDTEHENMETATFSFQPNCARDSQGTLTVTLNNAHTLYSGTPDCSVQMGDVELDSSMLFVGQNTLRFFSESGDYTLYNMKVTSDLFDVEYPTYYFQLSYEEEQDVLDDDLIVEATLEFAEEGESKAGYVSINGYKRHFDTTGSRYSFDISDYVTNGNNAITIQPSRTIEVREFLVELE